MTEPRRPLYVVLAEYGLPESAIRALVAAAPNGHAPKGAHLPTLGSLAPLDKPGTLSGNSRIVRIDSVEAEQVSWVWQGYIPLGKLTVVEGDPGLGKSMLVSADLAARVSTGGSMPDGSDNDLGGPAGVVILSAEDGLGDTIRPRLDAAGADVTRIVALAGVVDENGERLPTVQDLMEIEQAVATVEAKLVIIDPLMAYLDGATDSHKDQAVRRALAPLAALAERLNVSVVVVRHLNKGQGGDPLYRGGGSIGIIGAARSGLLVAKDPDDTTGARRILASNKCNLAQPPAAIAYRIETAANGAARVIWEGPTDHTARSLLAVPLAGEERTAVDDAKDFLLQLLEDGPQEVKVVQKEARAAGISERTLDRAKAALKVRACRTGGLGASGHWTWELSKSANPP